MDMLQRFQQFKNTLGGRDPQAMVQEMLRSGQMSQDQFKQLSQMADQLSQFIK